MIRNKVRLTAAMAAVSVGAAVVPVALSATPAQAAQCVNLTGEYATENLIYMLAKVKNICSGTYSFRIVFGQYNTNCFTIQGNTFAYYRYGTVWDPYPSRIQYC